MTTLPTYAASKYIQADDFLLLHASPYKNRLIMSFNDRIEIMLTRVRELAERKIYDSRAAYKKRKHDSRAIFRKVKNFAENR